MTRNKKMNQPGVVWRHVWVFAAALFCAHSATGEARPNVVFVMLDDLGYSQIEAYARGLSEADLDPALVEHVERKGNYTGAEAFRMVNRATPTLSRLADEGVLFTNAFSCSNLCAPARMGLATGILQNRMGMYRNIDVEEMGIQPNTHLAEQLQNDGYATAHIGKWHIGSRDHGMVARALEKHGIQTDKAYTYWSLGKDYPEIRKELKRWGFEGSVVREHHPLQHGFDYYYGYNQWESPFYGATNLWEDFDPVGPVQQYNTDLFTEKAMAFMDASIRGGKPFYVQLHYHAVHHPLNPRAPDAYLSRFDSSSHVLNNFYAHVYGVDANVRRLLAFLEERGVAENTMIVFTSDNGGAVGNASAMPGNAPYSGHKGMHLLGGFRVPLFVYWPEGITRPHVVNHLVSTLDIIPTAIDAAGIPVPAGLDGKSLLPVLQNSEAPPVRDRLVHGGVHARVWAFHGGSSFFKHNVSREKAPSAFIVVDDRYILRYVSRTIPKLYRDAVDGLPPTYELHDYIQDPLEQNNLYDVMPEQARKMISIWDQASQDFPPPTRWEREKWAAIMGPTREE
jgi:uncharacterized sulfatase